MSSRRQIRVPVKKHRRRRGSTAIELAPQSMASRANVRKVLGEVGEWLDEVEELLEGESAA